MVFILFGDACLSCWVTGGMGMEGREVMGLIMEKVELSSAPDGNERRRGGISV